MIDIDVTDKDALTLLLRSKTALGRLVEAEVHAVLAFLESIGFVHLAAAPVIAPEPEPETIALPPGEPVPDADPATVIAPPPA
jgi:hypothetical protein